jgi:hypothetical protein
MAAAGGAERRGAARPHRQAAANQDLQFEISEGILWQYAHRQAMSSGARGFYPDVVLVQVQRNGLEHAASCGPVFDSSKI